MYPFVIISSRRGDGKIISLAKKRIEKINQAYEILSSIKEFDYLEDKYDVIYSLYEEYREKKDYDKALILVNEIIDFIPIFPESYLLKADLLAEMHKYEEAIEYFEIAENMEEEIKEDEYIQYLKAQSQIEAKKFKDAVDDAVLKVNDDARDVIEDIVKKYKDRIIQRIDKVRGEELDIDEAEDEVSRLAKFAKKLEPDFQTELDELLRENLIIDSMLSKDPKDNVDFVDAMEQGKVVLIRMRDIDFDDDISIDILTTFFIQKIWIATKVRGTMHEHPGRCTVLIDEVFQSPTSQKLLTKQFVQSAKFGLKYVLTLHYMDQLSKEAQSALKNSNASYMLISGVDKKAFEALEEEFNIHGYCLDDLLNLKQYHSLNLIKSKDGYQSFITKLPPELKNN